MIAPQTVTPGEPIRAEGWNAVVAAIRAATISSVGPGLRLTAGSDGFTLSLDSELDQYKVPAVITAAPEGEDVPIEEAVYSARIMGTGAEVIDAVPRYGRVFANGVRVRPAKVGDYCRVVRMPTDGPNGPTFTADLEICSETVLIHVCGTPAGGGNGIPPDGTTPPPGEEEPPTPPGGSAPPPTGSAPGPGGEA